MKRNSRRKSKECRSRRSWNGRQAWKEGRWQVESSRRSEAKKMMERTAEQRNMERKKNKKRNRRQGNETTEKGRIAKRKTRKVKKRETRRIGAAKERTAESGKRRDETAQLGEVPRKIKKDDFRRLFVAKGEATVRMSYKDTTEAQSRGVEAEESSGTERERSGKIKFIPPHRESEDPIIPMWKDLPDPS